ncbi:hypothetical protein HOA59_03285 [archaeon]|jgi:GrpB-like predicted nucleotidyltransferase (UPF0157 family)|nr:hypothetical protein [archaeon]MBT6824431.1 hypothetical protein [archaeon]MBT7107290.1 hypothetical protein [archaeon]MBT7297407.1 hypothetical protein [archaeon]
MIFDENIVSIIEPTRELSDLFEQIRIKISSLIPGAKIELIGSLAIPMKGKPEMDILIQTEDVEITQDKLSTINFSKGPIIEEEGFCKNRDYKILIELHIVPFNHKRIHKYKQLIKLLQENEKLKKSFEKLKLSYEGKSIKEYKVAKNLFMEENNLLN